MKKQIAALFLTIACMLALCGCSLLTRKYDFTPEKDSFYVMANGQIKAAMIEDFDKEYYDLAELTYLAKQQVQDYNMTNYGQSYYSYDQMSEQERKSTLLAVALDSITESNGQVTLVFEYGAGKTYSEFNGIDIQKSGGTTVYTSPLESSSMQPSGTIVAAKGGKPITLEELAAKGGYNMVYVDYATKISFEHEVEYVSANVTVLNNNSVQTPAGDGSYIFYKR